MQTSLEKTYFNDLQEEYLEYLDHEGIDYLDVTEADQGHTFFNIKPQFVLSSEEMAKELGYESFGDYCKQHVIEINSDDAVTTVQRQFGRFTISYDGKDMFVNDAQDNQHAIFYTQLSPDLVELMCTGLVETIKTYNKTKESV